MEKHIKVLFIAKWFMNRRDPQLGVFIRKHASAAALYCDVSLVSAFPDENQKALYEFEESTLDNVKTCVVYYRKAKYSGASGKLLNFYRYLRAIQSGVARLQKESGRFDVINAYILLRPAFISWWISLRQNIPFVVSEQWSGFATGAYNKKHPMIRFLTRIVFARSVEVTAVSNFLADKMKLVGLKNNYSIIPNVVEPKEKKQSPYPSGNHVKILTVADLVDDIKNISGTIRVVTELSEKYPGIEFHIVGHGRDEKKLKALASQLKVLDKHVFFHGVKPNEEVFQYLHYCDFLVMNSRFETFSLICIEALSCGKPVIATRCGGPEDFINPSNGTLISPDNDPELRFAIEKMLAGHRDYNPETLKKSVLQHYTAAQAGRQFYEVYDRVLRR